MQMGYKLWRAVHTVSGNVEVKNAVLKVLGLTRRMEQDEFVFDLRNLMDRTKQTGVLQAAAWIFDSIGFLSPFHIRVKCLFPTNVGIWT